MIYDTYAEIILEKILLELLLSGTPPTPATITAAFEAFIAENDISQPLLDLDTSQVVRGETSSASKWNNTNNTILQDLKVLFRHLFKTSEQAVNNFNRWRTEAQLLEGKLDALAERINSLLLLSTDTAGYFNFVQDNFVDTSKIDLSSTTAYVNVQKDLVTLGTTNTGATRIDLSFLIDKDIEFTVLSRSNLISALSSSGSKTHYAVSDINNFWQDVVYTSKPGSISAELKINLQETTAISRVDIDLHMSNQNSTVQLTPMYSVDNHNWIQLPIDSFTRSVSDKSSFQFPVIETRWFKFIMTKLTFDQVQNERYAYEFGVDEISFFNEGFDTATTGSVLISQPLYVETINKEPEEFSKVTLEVCEELPTGTNIEYYVAAYNDINTPSTNFVRMDPVDRVNSIAPSILDFGDLVAGEITGRRISYSASTTTSGFINPAQTFTVLDSIVGTTLNTSSADASAVRYSFFNTNDRILDYEISTDIQIGQETLEIWRNVCTQGSNTKVRGVENGWRLEEPYYKTTVLVKNAFGQTIDFGGETIVIDSSPVNGVVTLSEGRHSVWVHKDNWKVIDLTSVTSLSTLQAADSLYPYNHRYLVEGLAYPGSYPDTDEKKYYGFDIVAEYFMQEVSVFDIIHNVSANDYSKFARDLDSADSSRSITNKDPLTVFVLKVDDTNPDFLNETFTIKLKSANTLYKYLTFKAILKTTDTSVAPILDSYRIKFGS